MCINFWKKICVGDGQTFVDLTWNDYHSETVLGGRSGRGTPDELKENFQAKHYLPAVDVNTSNWLKRGGTGFAIVKHTLVNLLVISGTKLLKSYTVSHSISK